MGFNVSGKYVRKHVDFDANDGWQRKWIYKIGWIGKGSKIHLVAMTDGMITNEFTEAEFKVWMVEKEMVYMSKVELKEFIEATIF